MISIVITAYNIKKYLGMCVDSVLRQTYQDFEVIIVDDCSCDGTAELCDQLARRDARISVIHQNENKGVSNARNVGVESSRGEYVYLIDGDDFIHPRMLEVLFLLLDGTEYDFSMVSGVKVPKEATVDALDNIVIPDVESESKVLPQRELISHLFGTNC